MDELNSSFGAPYSSDKYGVQHIEDAVGRYNELREQVSSAFSDDEKLLETNLKSLDYAFTQQMYLITMNTAMYLHGQSLHAYAEKVTGNPNHYEPHALAKNKDFRFDAFQENAQILMKQFADEYIKQAKSGDYTAAWKDTIEAMSVTKTTSVNSLSFNDFMIYADSTKFTGMTAEQIFASRSQLHNAFLNDPNLSEELRKILSL